MPRAEGDATVLSVGYTDSGSGDSAGPGLTRTKSDTSSTWADVGCYRCDRSCGSWDPSTWNGGWNACYRNRTWNTSCWNNGTSTTSKSTDSKSVASAFRRLAEQGVEGAALPRADGDATVLSIG